MYICEEENEILIESRIDGHCITVIKSFKI